MEIFPGNSILILENGNCLTILRRGGMNVRYYPNQKKNKSLSNVRILSAIKQGSGLKLKTGKITRLRILIIGVIKMVFLKWADYGRKKETVHKTKHATQDKSTKCSICKELGHQKIMIEGKNMILCQKHWQEHLNRDKKFPVEFHKAGGEKIG